MIEILKEKVKELVEKLSTKAKNNKSFPYMLSIFLLVFGYIFFLNSNSIIRSENKVDLTTPLNENIELGNTNVKMLSRKYSKSSNLVEFYIYSKSIDGIDNIKLDFEIREQQNVSKVIRPEVRRLDENNYIVRAKVPKNWNVLSLSVSEFKEENILLDNKEDITTQTQSSTIKFYIEHKDIDKVSSLKEKKASEYLAEGIDLEIVDLKNIIVEKNKEINQKGIKIDELKENIVKLEEDKVYQTKIEKSDTNSRINAINSKIDDINKDIKKLHAEVRELKDRIKNLNDKKAKVN